MFQGIIDKFYLNNHPDGKPPKKFVTGVLLLYLAVILQTVNNFLDGFNFSAAFFVFFVAGYLVYATGEGIKWARVVLSVLIVLNMLTVIFTIADAFGFIKTGTNHQKDVAVPPHLIVLFMVEIIVELFGLAMIFTKQADGWFNRVKRS